MPVPAGTRFGPYEILSPLGAGGMGEVYRAKDTRLDRTVAIKVLNSQLIANAELRARFEREARIISQLQHPHICVLHDVGHEGDTDFLVMEFLEGESLADRLRKGPLPTPQLLKTAIEIADALEKAHRAGVVHRDLKPGNVMLTKLGAKLLDFGLAKPVTASTNAGGRGSGSASIVAAALTQTSPAVSPASPLSTAGAVIGTVQYMSPEQVQGLEADARSDIFAFGVMLFEMATSKRAFEAKTQAGVVGQILAVDPPSASTVRSEVSPSLDRVIHLCLEKDPDERIQTAHDLKLDLQAIAAENPADRTGDSDKVSRAKQQARLGWSAAIVGAAALGVLATILFHHPTQSVPSIRASVDPPPNTFFLLTGDSAGPPVVSPDGKLIAFTAVGAEGTLQIWVRPINSVTAHPIEGTVNANFPFWSPDSRSLGFFVLGKLKKVDVNTGSPVEVTDTQQGRGGAWGPGGTIVFSPSPNAALMKVSQAGGTAEPLTKLDPQLDSHRWPFFLPDGKHFLYLAINHDPSKAANDAIYYASFDGRENRPLFRAQSNAVYANGFLLFAQGDKLLAQPFNPAKGELSGEPQVIASGVINDSISWHMDVSAAEDGLLIYSSGALGSVQLVWVDRSGKDLGIAADNTPGYSRLSPQGDRLALQMDTGAGVADIFVLDLARGVRTRLTFGPVSNSSPRWSRDGKWIYFASLFNGRYRILRKLADGSSAEENVFSNDQDVFPEDCSPDGKTLLFTQRASGDSSSLWSLPLADPVKPSKIVENGRYPSFSPDGRYIVYDSNESGRYEVYVVPFGDRKGKWQVSSNGGILPAWSRDGKEIFYASLENSKYSLVSAPVKEQAEGLQIGASHTLVSTMKGIPVFDVSPDGKKILIHRLSQQGNQSVTLVTNFAEDLKK